MKLVAISIVIAAVILAGAVVYYAHASRPSCDDNPFTATPSCVA